MISNSLKSLRGFLGLIGYYRKFIKGYGFIATSLTILLKKNAFDWCESIEIAFRELKQAVTQPPMLRLPDFSKHFTMECDVELIWEQFLCKRVNQLLTSALLLREDVYYC